MKYILLPLMKSRDEKQEVIRKTVELAKCVEDDYEQVSLIAGILTATDRYINEDYAQNVREWLKMTKVERIIAKEVEDAREEARQEARNEARKEMALEFLSVLSPEIVAENTGLSLEEVLQLKAAMK